MKNLLSVNNLLTDEEFRQRLFPISANRVYAAHAAVSPIPEPVREAMVSYINASSTQSQFEYLYSQSESGVRQLAAQMMDVDHEEVALVPSTSAGLSMIAAGLDWRPGDSVIAFAGDFPSNVYPWTNLASRGVDVRLIPPNPEGVVLIDDVLNRVDARTRLVALSTMHFCTGARLQIEEIAPALRSRGILLVLDAIQGLQTSDRCMKRAQK